MVGSQVRCSCGACQRVRCLVAVILAAVLRLPRRCAAVTLGAPCRVTSGALPRSPSAPCHVTSGAPPRSPRCRAALPPARCRAPSASYRVTLRRAAAHPRRRTALPPARCRAPSVPCRVTSGVLPRPPSARCAALPPADCRGHPRRAVPRYLRRPAAVTLGAVSRLPGWVRRDDLYGCAAATSALSDRRPKPHVSQARGLPTLGILGRAYR
jgi:hypothetical protein